MALAGHSMKIYLAGPDVFLPDAVEIGRRKAAICARHGLTGLYPLDNAIDIAAGESWSMNSSGRIIARIRKPPSSMP